MHAAPALSLPFKGKLVPKGVWPTACGRHAPSVGGGQNRQRDPCCTACGVYSCNPHPSFRPLTPVALRTHPSPYPSPPPAPSHMPSYPTAPPCLPSQPAQGGCRPPHSHGPVKRCTTWSFLMQATSHLAIHLSALGRNRSQKTTLGARLFCMGQPKPMSNNVSWV